MLFGLFFQGEKKSYEPRHAQVWNRLIVSLSW